MVDHEHEPENLDQIDGTVRILHIFEERYEDAIDPIIIQSVLFLINLVDLDDTLRTKRSKTTLEQSQKLFFHRRREVLITNFIISQEECFKFIGIHVVEIVFDFGIHFVPEIFVVEVQLLH